ncbi:lysostaphin resistance A-like protein [Ornithinimicrobium sp. LYQ92]|uniref:CPBP family intramembrane glutamic endopeptidase n=1 Tax=Serinicoccus sp. LYQ92 TaxID=3378798 RepID=UPI003853EAF1
MPHTAEQPSRAQGHRIFPLWLAIVWIVVYIVAIGVGDTLSLSIGRENSATAVVVLALSVGLVLYLGATSRLREYGVRAPRSADYRTCLFYLPLLVIACLQYAKGLDGDLDAVAIALVILLMVGVGFAEELIFRGFLYRAIAHRSGVRRAVVISGVTFGLGHVVNLARGYTGLDQILQVVVAIAVGIVLALLVAVTGSIMPGVVFHVLFNISGSLTADDRTTEVYVAAAVLAICAAYSVHLVRQLRHRGTSEAVPGAAVDRGGRHPMHAGRPRGVTA